MAGLAKTDIRQAARVWLKGTSAGAYFHRIEDEGREREKRHARRCITREQFMSKPKRHHYIAQMHSKRFADPDGILYVFDKRFPHKGVQKRTPRNLFVEGDFYTQFDDKGNKDVSVETEFLAPLEDKASPVIERIVSAARRGDPPNLSPDEKEVWVRFSYNQFVRVPETREKHKEDVLQEIRRKIDFIGRFQSFTDPELSILADEDKLERLWRNSSIRIVRTTSAKVSEILSEKRICAAVIRKPKPRRSFVIGSNPVVKMSNPGRSHLADPTVEVWLPLARDVVVTPCPGERDKVVSANDRHIRAINRSVFKQSTVIAGCSRELIEFVRGSAN